MNETNNGTSVANTAVLAFQNAAAGIHAQFANTLVQAGHAVNENNTASELLNVAAQASATVGKSPGPNTAPNYADFVIGSFLRSMEGLMMQFAAVHLPSKFRPVAAELDEGIRSALGLANASPLVVAEKVTEMAAAVATVADPAAAPIIAAAEPVAETLETAVLGHYDETSAEAPGEVEAPTQAPSKLDLLHD